jgi:hypothetical protein
VRPLRLEEPDERVDRQRIPKVISMLNSTYISVRYGHSVKMRAEQGGRLITRQPDATAYIAQPESAQNRISVRL